jgi:Na+:H+ antiporter, NhaA family
MSEQRYPLERLFGRVLTPFEEFLQRTTAGGIVLVGATIAALVLATFVGSEGIHHFWDRRVSLAAPGLALELTLHHLVNDALMALFFLVVGLELKREVLVGELASPRDAALPAIAALGGMIVPAAIYAGLNAGTAGQAGWGIPMATDIAFAVGILVLLAWRIPRNLIVFLTALAIVDDLGAVLVIAIFYTSTLDTDALAAAAGLFGLLVLFNRAGIRHSLPYVLAGIALWYAVLASGIHATVAGMLLAATIPARPAFKPESFLERIEELHSHFHGQLADLSTPGDPLRNHEMARIAAAMERSAWAVQSPLQRIEHALVPWVTFLIVPIFALANAAIDLSAIRWGETVFQPVTLGVALGLVIGKFIGIASFSWIGVRFGLGRLPAGVEWKHLLGAAWLAGIGFTMSLFIAELAFRDAAQIQQAKLGILLASAAAAAIGLAWLYFAAGREPATERTRS